MVQVYKADKKVYLAFADVDVEPGEVIYVDFESGNVTVQGKEYEDEAKRIRPAILQGWFKPDRPNAPKGTILRVLEESIRG